MSISVAPHSIANSISKRRDFKLYCPEGNPVATEVKKVKKLKLKKSYLNLKKK